MSDESPPRTIGIYAPAIRTTGPDVIRRHSISDEELTMLCDGSESRRGNIIAGAAGAFIGAFPGAMIAGQSVVASRLLTVADYANLAIMVSAATTMIVVLALTKTPVARAAALSAEIRRRGT